MSLRSNINTKYTSVKRQKFIFVDARFKINALKRGVRAGAHKSRNSSATCLSVALGLGFMSLDGSVPIIYTNK